MPRYTITLAKEHGGKYYQGIVDAEDEKEAFKKVRTEAESKGIKLPDEIWTRTHKHKNT